MRNSLMNKYTITGKIQSIHLKRGECFYALHTARETNSSTNDKIKGYGVNVHETKSQAIRCKSKGTMLLLSFYTLKSP